MFSRIFDVLDSGFENHLSELTVPEASTQAVAEARSIKEKEVSAIQR
jgi:hypothetical protein